METKPTEEPTYMTSTTSSTTSTTLKEPASTPVSPWEVYLTGRKVPAEKFIAKMEEGTITIPDEAMRSRFAKALSDKPDRVTRLILLLQASTASKDNIRRIVVEFAEAAIKQLNVVSFPEPLDADGFRSAVWSWLVGIRQKPLKASELNILYLLLHLGWIRQLLDYDAALRLVDLAVSKPEKPKSKPRRTKPSPTPIEVLLSAEPKVQVLSTLLAYSKASNAAIDKLNTHIDAQATEIARLTSECQELKTTVADYRTKIATLQEQKASAETQVAKLEEHIVELQDGYRHKLSDLRGRIRGVLQGQLTRWLQTALDASRSDPPFAQAIQERLEDALDLIEKEIRWLQPSA